MSLRIAVVAGAAVLGLAAYGAHLFLTPEADERVGPRAPRRTTGPPLIETRPDEGAESRGASRPADGPAESVAPPPGSVRGRVVDRGGIPVNHAKVTAKLRTPPGERNYALVADYNEEAKVDAEGRFQLLVPGGGVFRFTAEAEGFAPATRDGVRPGDEFELILDVGAALEIRVTDLGTSKPVAGVDIILRAQKGAHVRRAKTPADGVHRFVDLPAGVAVLEFDHEEYVPKAGVERSLELGESATVTVELDAGKTIKGQVLSSDEQRPIEGAIVTVRKKKATTDSGGRFLVKGLAAEPHEIQTVAEGFLANQRSVNLAGSRRQAEAEIYLDRGATVRGRVVNESGEAVVGAELKIFESWGGRWGGGDDNMWEDWSSRHLKAKTGEDGAFRISGIMPQQWSERSLRVRHPDYADAFEKGLKIAKKEDELFVAITMRKGGVISGRVADDQNRPIGGARVELRPKNMWENQWGDEYAPDGTPISAEKNLKVLGTDGDGAFSFDNLTEGKYDLRVEAKGWSTGFKGDVALSRGGRVEAIQFTLEKGEPLKGYVVDAEEKPVSGVRLYVSTKNGFGQAVSGPDGAFQIETIPKGPYDVNVNAVGYATLNLRKQMPEGERGLRIVIKKQGVLRGKVIDVATKKPIAGAWLSLEKEEPRWGNSMRQWAWANSEKDGTFKMQADDGAYRLSCGAGGYVRYRKDETRLAAEEANAEPIVVELKAGGAIEGFVRGPDGKPDGGTTVYWRKDDPTARFQYGGDSEMDGYFFCGDLDSGNYELVFQRPGYPMQVLRGVYVGGDKPAQVDVQLRPDAMLNISVAWLEPETPPPPEGEVVAAATEGAPNPPKRPRRTPRPNVYIESLDDVPLQLDWDRPQGGEEGYQLGKRRWVWLGGGNARAFLNDLPAGRYRVRAQARQHEDCIRIVNLRSGERSNVVLEMKPLPGYTEAAAEPRMRRGSYMDENGEVRTYWYSEDG